MGRDSHRRDSVNMHVSVKVGGIAGDLFSQNQRIMCAVVDSLTVIQTKFKLNCCISRSLQGMFLGIIASV